MNAYEKSQALGLTGSDTEIVSILHTLTESDIHVSAVAEWLRVTGLWYCSGPAAMSGELQKLMDEPGTPDEVKAGLGQLWSAVFGGSAMVLRTTDPVWAGVVWSIISGVSQLSHDSAGLVDSFYAMGGGRPYVTETADRLAILRADFEKATAAAAIRTTLSQFANSELSGFTTRHKAASTAIENGTATTLDQVKAILAGA